MLTLLQILIWGKKVLTLCQKMHFFNKTTRFPLKIAKKTFSIEISKSNAHTLPFHFTWSVKTTQKLFRSFLIHNKRYSELFSVFELLFQFEMKPSNSPLFSWDGMFSDHGNRIKKYSEHSLELKEIYTHECVEDMGEIRFVFELVKHQPTKTLVKNTEFGKHIPKSLKSIPDYIQKKWKKYDLIRQKTFISPPF